MSLYQSLFCHPNGVPRRVHDPFTGEDHAVAENGTCRVDGWVVPYTLFQTSGPGRQTLSKLLEIRRVMARIEKRITRLSGFPGDTSELVSQERLSLAKRRRLLNMLCRRARRQYLEHQKALRPGRTHGTTYQQRQAQAAYERRREDLS